MALTHVTTARNAMVDALLARVNLGSALASGRVQYATDSAFTSVLATLTCSNPAFAAAAGGTAAANTITADPSAVGGGVAAFFRFIDRDGNEVFRGTISGTSGAGDLKLNNTTITAADLVQLPSFTYTTVA